MSCPYECHQIGGPWIAENPSCPIHRHGGIAEQLSDMEDGIERVRLEARREPLSDALALVRATYTGSNLLDSLERNLQRLIDGCGVQSEDTPA